MTFTQFIDYLLWALYEQERRQGTGHYFDLNELARMLRQPVEQQWVLDAARVLESRGLARGIFTLGGYVSAMLTGEGRLHVEDRIGRDGAFIHELAGKPRAFVKLGDDGLAAVANGVPSIEEQRAPTLELLDSMQAALNASPLEEDERDDVRADLATLRAQLAKREPNLGVLAGVLEPMSGRYPFLSGYVSRLTSLLFV